MAADEDDDYMGDLERFIPKEELLPSKPASQVIKKKFTYLNVIYFKTISTIVFSRHIDSFVDWHQFYRTTEYSRSPDFNSVIISTFVGLNICTYSLVTESLKS